MSTPAQAVFDPDAFMATRQGASAARFDPDAFMANRQQGEKPGFLSRTSEALLGVSHPGDQLMSEASALYHKPLAAFSEAGKRVFQTLTGAQFPTIEGIKEDIANPLGRAKEAFKNVSGVPGMVIHPAKAAENITASRSLTDDLGNLNYAAAIGDIVGGAANLGLTFADPGKAAAEAAEETAAKAATEETAKASVPKSVPIQPKSSALGAVAGDFAKTLGIIDPPPESLMTRAVKPLASNTGWDAAIKKALPDLKATEDSIGRPITGVDDALEAAAVAKRKLWSEFEAKLRAAGPREAILHHPASLGATIDGNKVADAMMDSIDQRTKLQNPGLVDRIQKVSDTYRRPMPVQEAEDFLQSANNDLHGYYAKNKVGRQVAERDPETGHIVAEADALRDALYSKLDEVAGPGAADLKQRYGALTNIETELLRSKNVAARQQPQSLAEQLTYARAIGKIAVGAARMSPGSVLEGMQSIAAAKWLKERGDADAMITRAFQNVGKLPSASTAAKAARATAPVLGMLDDTAKINRGGQPGNQEGQKRPPTVSDMLGR